MATQGFSSINPALARGYQGVIINGKRVKTGGGGSGKKKSTPQPNVKVNGNTVFINGQGFSVAPTLQESFIKNRVGSSNASAQVAIKQVQDNLKRQEEQRIRLQQAQKIKALNEIINKEEGYRKIVAQQQRKKLLASLQSTRFGLTNNAGIDELLSAQGGIKDQQKDFSPLMKPTVFKNNNYNVSNTKARVEKRKEEARILSKEGKTAHIRAINQALRLGNTVLSNLLGYVEIGATVGNQISRVATSRVAQRKLLNAINRTFNPQTLVRQIPNTAVILRQSPKVAKRLKELYVAEMNRFTNFVVNNPSEAIVILGTDFLVFEGAAKVISKLSLLANDSKFWRTFYERFKIKGGRLIDGVGTLEGLRIGSRTTLKAASGITRNEAKTLTLEVINGRIDKYVDYKIGQIERDTGVKLNPYVRNIVRGKIRLEVEKDLRRKGLNLNTLDLLKKKKSVSLISRINKGKNTVRESVSKVIKKIDVRRKAYKITKDYKKAISQAVRIRDKAFLQGKKLPLYEPVFDDAIKYIVDYTDAAAQVRGVNFIRSEIRSGVKISVDEANKMLREYRDKAFAKLSQESRFKELVKTAELNRTDAIKFLRISKLNTPRRMFNELVKKIKVYISGTRFGKLLREISNKIKRGKGMLKRGIQKVKEKRRISKLKRGSKLKERKVRRNVKQRKKARRKELIPKQKKYRSYVRQTIRYQMEKRRPIRVVTPKDLLNIVNAQRRKAAVKRTFTDFFKQIEKRQLIPIEKNRWKELKNVLIKRGQRAVNKGDRAELKKISDTFKSILKESNSKAKAADVSIKIDKPTTLSERKIKTIKDFEFDSPQSEGFVEVRQGDKVLLQRTEQKTKQGQIARQAVKAKVVKVVKKTINLGALYKFIAFSILRQVAAAGYKAPTRQATARGIKPAVSSVSGIAQSVKVLQKQFQNTKQLQDVFQKSAVDSVTQQAFQQLFKTPLRLRQVQEKVQEETKKRKFGFIVNSKKSSNSNKKRLEAFNVYAKPIKTVSGKKATRLIRVNDAPLSKQDALDLRNYVVDTSLARTGEIRRTSPTRRTSSIKIQKGYARKTMNKFRNVKIKNKRTKRLTQGRVIEKTKNILDTVGEKKQISLRKRIKSLQTKKRKITPSQRKKLLLNLEKARMAKKKKQTKKKKK